MRTTLRRLSILGGGVIAACSAALLLMMADTANAAPTVKAVPGRPVLFLGMYDVSTLGYSLDEYFVAGQAGSYKPAAPLTLDGRWKVTAGDKAAYATRVVVAKPTDPAKFNGTVVVEWFNVTGGQDIGPDWAMTHRELTRKGYVWVGVSAQKVGVEGGASLIGSGQPLKKSNPQRYGELSHPGDAYSFDIFSQVGQLLRSPGAGGLLGDLKPKTVLAVGESQSAGFLVSYVNAADASAKAYDGFLIHSRFGFAARLDGASAIALPGNELLVSRLRPDLRVPVIVFITETDLVDGRRPGYNRTRQPDNAKLRVWEIPGTAHADNYTLQVGFMDTGAAPLDRLAAAWAPTNKVLGTTLPVAINNGPQHHYGVQAALAQLNTWVTTGKAPPRGAPIATEALPAGGVKIKRDSDGLALGGVRTPWMDVPIAVTSGESKTDELPAALFGTSVPFDTAKLQKLYPGGKADYLKKFEASLDKTIAAGFLLAADRQEILELAAASWPKQ